MTRGEGTQTKVHLKKNDEDYIIFVESEAAVKEWKASDNTVALAQVVDAFKIFTTHKQGQQGKLESPPAAMLENDFGTKDEETIIKEILKTGNVVKVSESGRSGPKNDSMGSMASH